MSEAIRIPAERVKPLVERLIAERDIEHAPGYWAGGQKILSDETGLPTRRFYGIINEDVGVGRATVDKILVLTGNFMLWYTPPEEEGFADYYGEDAPKPRRKTHVVSKGPRKKKECSECKAVLKRANTTGLCVTCFRAKRSEQAARCLDCGKKTNSKKVARCQPCYYKSITGRAVPAKSRKWIANTGSLMNRKYHGNPDKRSGEQMAKTESMNGRHMGDRSITRRALGGRRKPSGYGPNT